MRRSLADVVGEAVAVPVRDHDTEICAAPAVLLDPTARHARRRPRSDAELIDLWAELTNLARYRQSSTLWEMVRMHLVRKTLGCISRISRSICSGSDAAGVARVLDDVLKNETPSA